MYPTADKLHRRKRFGCRAGSGRPREQLLAQGPTQVVTDMRERARAGAMMKWVLR